MRIALSALLLLLLTTSAAHAQDQRKQDQRKRPQPKREKLPKEARLLGYARGVLKVQTEDGKMWLVGMGRSTESISVVGKADASWLQPGMLVRFSARFDRRGEGIAPIEDLSVVTLREGMRFGLTPENLRPAGPAGAAGNLFSDPDEAAAKKVKKPPRPKKLKPQDIAYTVVGKISKIKKNDITIVAGRLLKIELAEQPRIDVDVADITLASAGTVISLDAWYYPNMPGRAMANRVTIALEKTLEGANKRRVLPGQTAQAKPSEGETKSDKDADDKDPEKKDDDDASLVKKDPFAIEDK